MTPKRWTLVVVCAATAMLMLDIAVAPETKKITTVAGR